MYILVSFCLPFPLSSSFSLFFIRASPSPFQMDVVYTFQTSQTAVPGALRRQPSVVSQHNDAKTVSSPTHVGLSPSTAMALPAPASSSTAGSEWLLTHKPNCFCTSNQSTITTFFLTSLSNCLSLSLSLRSPNACARSLSL